MSDVVPDGLDEMDHFADEFERLGRAAGAELRATPTSDGERAVARSAGRRRSALAAGKVAIALALVVGTAWVVRSDDQPLIPSDDLPVPVDPGWIAYEARLDDRLLLFLIRPDGSDPHPLVPELDGGDQSKPDWSPDGKQIVFTMADGGRESLWTVGVDGSNPQMLLECSDECAFLDDPSWSPDGGHVVYGRMANDGDRAIGTLEQVDLATGTVEVLLEGEGHDFFAGPRWSPDGRSLVVEVVHRDTPTLEAEVTGETLSVVDLRGSTPTVQPLPGASADAVNPDWSPRGDLIVYAAPASPTATNNDLFTIAPTGGSPQRITFFADDGGYAAFPSFDHSSHRIVFSAVTPNSAPMLAHVDIDGDNLVNKIGQAFVSASHPRP